MKIGAIVQAYRIGEELDEHPWHKKHFFGPKGVVIGVIPNDSYERIVEGLVIRWDNGKIENYLYEDENDYWIEDVTPKLYVNIYLSDRVYGGPEEGGWWYDCGSVEQIILCETTDEALEKYEEMQGWADNENKDRRPPSSMLSEGHYIVELSAWPGEHYPQSRPIIRENPMKLMTVGELENVTCLEFTNYVLIPDGMDTLEAMNKWPDHKRCYHGANLDAWEQNWYAFWVEDCFDPPVAIVKAGSFEEAYKIFLDEFSWAEISEADIKDYDSETLHINSSGKFCDTEGVNGTQLKLVRVHL